MLLLIESLCYPVILYVQHKANPFVIIFISKSGVGCSLQQTFPLQFNSKMWSWRDSCHRHDSRVSGISLENGMLHVASSMGAFLTSSLYPAPPTERPAV